MNDDTTADHRGDDSQTIQSMKFESCDTFGEQSTDATQEVSQTVLTDQPNEVTSAPKENTLLHSENHSSNAKMETEAKGEEKESKGIVRDAAKCDDEEDDEDDDEDEGEVEFEPFGDECDDEFSDGWVEDDDENEEAALLMKLNFHLSRLMGRDKNPELPPSVTRLRIQDDERNAVIYLIGTAHFSEVSNKEVTDLIQAVSLDFTSIALRACIQRTLITFNLHSITPINYISYERIIG